MGLSTDGPASRPWTLLAEMLGGAGEVTEAPEPGTGTLLAVMLGPEGAPGLVMLLRLRLEVGTGLVALLRSCTYVGLGS